MTEDQAKAGIGWIVAVLLAIALAMILVPAV